MYNVFTVLDKTAHNYDKKPAQGISSTENWKYTTCKQQRQMHWSKGAHWRQAKIDWRFESNLIPLVPRSE